MGILTWTDLKEEITIALGNRNDPEFTPARITRALNLCQNRIARTHKWEELNTSMSHTLDVTNDPYDDRIVQMPPNTRDIYTIRVYDTTRTRKLIRNSRRKQDEDDPANEYISRMLPSAYVRFGPNLELDTAPDVAYQLRAKISTWPTPFSGTTEPLQKTDLDHKDDVLVALTVNYFYYTLGNYERAEKWWAIYAQGMSTALSEEESKADISFNPSNMSGGMGEYWLDPFVSGSP